MPALTLDEHRRIEATLRRRFRSTDPDNFVAVGLGHALRNHRFDRTRDNCVCVFVRRKKRRISVTREIPSEVRVRLRDGRHYRTLTWATDVIAVGKLQASAVYRQYGSSLFTVGLKVGWSGGALQGDQPLWMTVGHPFYTPRGSRAGARRSNDDFHAIAQTRRGSRFDAAIVKASLAAETSDDEGEHWPVLSLPELVAVPGRAGESVRAEGRFPMKFQAFLPRLPIEGVGTLVNVVSGAGKTQTFEPGTSGAVWLHEGIPAAMQVAAVQPRFRLGFAQALTSSLVWAEQAIRQLAPGRSPAGPLVVREF